MKPDVLLRPAPGNSAPGNSASDHSRPWEDHSRPWDRLAVRLLGPSLDRQLATGRPPQSSRALAIRARQIVSPAGRRELAQYWIHVLDLAIRPPVPLPLHGTLSRGAVAAAERDVREMIGVLTGGLPVAARGAALASWLLRDGNGPLHNQSSPLELSAAVQDATRQMGSVD
jgi:hypothetical protein